MSSSSSTKKRKKKKKERVSIRDQLKAAQSGKSIADAVQTSDPIGSLEGEWFKKAKDASTWKDRFECMQTLMGFCCGDSFGNSPLPESFEDHPKAGDVISIFAKYINEEKHIFTRQHILKLLVPFGKSFKSKTAWKKANKLAEGIISIQWAEKKHGFNQFVTPALISVYIASNAQLKKWKVSLIEAINSPQAQSGSKLKSRGPKDVQMFINDESVIEQLKHTILNDKEKEVRDACAKFIYGAKKICSKTSILEAAYDEIMTDKRAATSLSLAADMFNNDKNVLLGGKGNDEAIAKKMEAKQQKAKKKQKQNRKNNMRAMIAKARKEAAKQGGGGQIEVAAAKNTKTKKESSSESDSDSDEEDKNKKQQRAKKKVVKPKHVSSDDDDEEEESPKITKRRAKKQVSKPKAKAVSSDDEDDKSEEATSESDSEDSEDERRKREKERERQRKERQKERQRKKMEKEKEIKRKKKEKEEEQRREKERLEQERKQQKEKKRKRRYSSSESEASTDSESESSSDANYNKRKRGKRKDLRESKTEKIDASKSSAKTNKERKASSTSNAEIQNLTQRIDKMDQSVKSLQNGMKGMEQKMTSVAKNSQSKSGMSSKTEEKIMRILATLQKDVKIMKSDISYIKACWEDAESVPSD